VTDPGNQMGVQDGWNDAGGSENSEKRAWTGLQNVTLGGNAFAVQPLGATRLTAGQGACAVADYLAPVTPPSTTRPDAMTNFDSSDAR